MPREPHLNHVSANKSRRQRPYAKRKPKEYEVNVPGDPVQLDTREIRPLPGTSVQAFHCQGYDLQLGCSRGL